eukprot:COSAG01_NODE_2594_length_7402_cov_7.251951_1_plen_174_part_10
MAGGGGGGGSAAVPDAEMGEAHPLFRQAVLAHGLHADGVTVGRWPAHARPQRAPSEGQRWATALPKRPAVCRPFPSWNRSTLTEMYPCHACPCREMLRAEPAAGQAERLRTARHEAFVEAEQTRHAVRRAAREARPRWHREAEQLAVHSHALAIPGRAQRLRAELASLPPPPLP